MPHLLSRTQTGKPPRTRGSAHRRGGARHHRRAHRMHIRLEHIQHAAGLGRRHQHGAAHRRRLHLRRAVLHQGVRRLPAVPPRRHGQLRLGRQQRRHHPVHRRDGELRRHRRPGEQHRPGRRPRRPRRPSPGRPRRHLRRLQRHDPQRLAETDRPGPRPDLPRPDHPLERPGHHRPQPRRPTSRHLHHRRAPRRRQRHHLHLQRLPLPRQPRLGHAVGAGRSLHWPVGYGADGNQGVASTILRIPGSIGYAEDSYTAGTAINSAAIANRDGNYVTPTPATITADAAAKPAITPEDFSIVNEPGADAYPISGYSWVLVSASQPSKTAGQALVALLGWLTGPGQSYAADLGYVPLPLPSSSSPPPHSPASPDPAASR